MAVISNGHAVRYSSQHVLLTLKVVSLAQAMHHHYHTTRDRMVVTSGGWCGVAASMTRMFVFPI